MTGATMILVERERQISPEGEGYDTTSDRVDNRGGELLKAARAYILTAEAARDDIGRVTRKEKKQQARTTWPWNSSYFKPKSSIVDLVRAGALIAAEIDRLIAEGETP